MLLRYLLLLPLCCLRAVVGGATAAEFEAGTAVDGQVVALTKSNFKLAIRDPANPFWLLKFYAPW